MRNTTVMPKLQTPTKHSYGDFFMLMTDAERIKGRIMRAPDHDASGGESAASDGGGDAGDGAGQDTQGVANAGAGDKTGETGDSQPTLAGAAKADASAGEGGKGDEGDKGKDGEADVEGPPEAYELKLTVKAEDGTDTDIPMDPALVEAATPILKELGLTNEQANKILPLVPQVQARVLQQQADEFATVRKGWADEVMADKDMGGKNWPKTESFVAKALDTFEPGPEFRKFLDETGMGNHPSMIRMLREVGQKVGEDGAFPRGDAAAVKQSPEAILYPNDVPKGAAT